VKERAIVPEVERAAEIVIAHVGLHPLDRVGFRAKPRAPDV
jgi:hypothetical protein